nr:penicillin-binding protein [Actinomycetales bacterium]
MLEEGEVPTEAAAATATGAATTAPGSTSTPAGTALTAASDADDAETVTVPLTWTFNLGDDAAPVTFATLATLRLESPDADDDGAAPAADASAADATPAVGTPAPAADTSAADATPAVGTAAPAADTSAADATPAVGTAAPAGPAWRAVWDPTLVHPNAVPTSTFTVSTLRPTRGEIVATDGTALVTVRDVWRVGIDKMNLTDPAQQDASARELAARVGLDPGAFAGRVAAAGEKAYVIAITIRQSEAEQWDVDGLRAIPGVLLQPATVPLGPTAAFARPVLGTVAEATAEIIENSGGAIQPGDMVGSGGLEAAYEEQLRGIDGYVVELVDTEGGPGGPAAGAGGTEPVEIARAAAADGQPLVVTLDESLQLLAEDLLSGIEGPSAIAAIRPSDGHVLALASGPGSAGYNTAALGQYAPGSTFKVATALTLLRAGYTAETVLDCTTTSTVDGRAFSNYPGYPADQLGGLPLRTAIAYSCNTALINESSAVTAADVSAAAASLGLGTPGPWAFPYFAGSIPDDAVGTSHAASLIGQGGVLVSPLAMASVAASVAVGETVVPVLLPEVEQSVGPDSATAALTEEEVAALASAMREVVTAGTSQLLLDVPGEPVYAKSGTAEWASGDSAGIHAWMIAYQGDLAVAVFIESADHSGAGTAGPLLRDLLTRLAAQ